MSAALLSPMAVVAVAAVGAMVNVDRGTTVEGRKAMVTTVNRKMTVVNV